jgi:hypothetical protein
LIRQAEFVHKHVFIDAADFTNKLSTWYSDGYQAEKQPTRAYVFYGLQIIHTIAESNYYY